MRALGGGLGGAPRGGVANGLIKRHHHVRRHLLLYGGRDLGAEVPHLALGVAEVHAVIIDGGGAGAVETDSLVAAAVGEYVARPAGESVQTSGLGHGIATGRHPQVVRVGEDDIRPEAAEVFGVDSFDRAPGADGHEGGRFDDAMTEGEAARPRRHRSAGEKLEFQARSSSIASPKL